MKTAPALPEVDTAESRQYPDCGSRYGLHDLDDDHPDKSDDRMSSMCVACKQVFAKLGE